MPYSLQQLSDAEDIKVLKHRYFRAIDTADEALLRTMFTDDVFVEYRGGEYLVSLTGNEPMIEFVLNSFHAGVAGMHHGHMPEITLTGDDTAEGIWYLEDIAINAATRTHTSGSAIYRDRYRREGGTWKIAHTEYDRVIELIRPLGDDERITAHHLAVAGRKPHERTDIGHLISWTEAA